VAKEALAMRRWDGERYVTQRALPMRIPVADWAHINRYFNEPADFSRPAAGETWSEHELHAYGDWLSEEQVQSALSVQSYEEEAEDVVSPQPTIAEVKLAWIEEATRVGLVKGPQDLPGLQELKQVLGETYSNLAPGCDVERLRIEGLQAIGARGNGRQAA
jgi:hypothetical protein